MTPEALQQLLRQYGIKPKAALGQNFLTSDIVLTDLADSVPAEPGDAILEVGPGVGNLTERLIARKNFVLAIERDRTFKPILAKLSKQHKNFRFEFADILRFDFQQVLEEFKTYHVVANIPYYITGKIIQLFLQAEHRPKSMTLLVQKEVAQNLAARPGQLNLLALSVQVYGQAAILMPVPRQLFFPVPKVDSAGVQILLDPKPKLDKTEQKKFFSLLRACFAGKRKQLHNTLVNNAGYSKEKTEVVLSALGLSPKVRPQELSLQTWIKLFNLLQD